MSSFHERMQAIEDRISALEAQFVSLNKYYAAAAELKSQSAVTELEGAAKVKQSLFNHRVFNYRLVTVPSDYYDRNFQARADILSATIPQLCKSLIFENVDFDATCRNGEDDNTYSKYYLVLLQYEAKFDTIKFENLIWSLRPVLSRLAKSKFNFKLASEENNNRLSGYKHNAVTPFGMIVERLGAVTDVSGLVIKHIPIG